MGKEPKLKVTPNFAGRIGITPTRIRTVLGVLWILDALLQLQPRMFSKELVTQMFLPMTSGQPAPVAWVITTASHLIAPDTAVWNFLFAALQVSIGIGLLIPRTVKPALVAMWVWSFGVWWVGEGLGGLLTAHTSPLSGAPGAVLIYAAIGVLVWPTESGAQAFSRKKGRRVNKGLAGFDSSAGAFGPFGVRAALGAWTGLWSLFAILWLLPANRSATSIHDTLVGMATGEPGWYSHFLNWLAGGFATSGAQWAWIMAAISLAIGIGPLVSRRVTGFFIAGAALELIFWISGQALGGTMTGMGSDPNAGPLVALLALAIVPTAVAIKAPQTAIATRIARINPIALGSATAGLAAAMLLSATYPGAALESASSSSASGTSTSNSTSPMAGMPGMSTSTSATPSLPGSKLAASSQPSDSVQMASNSIIPGAMGAIDPTWSYTGPPLPGAETNLLTDVGNITDQGHKMQTPSCTTTPTSTQLEAALRLTQDTSSAVAQYKNLSAATAAGYIPVTSLQYPMVHYINPSYLQAKYVMDPNHVQALVYDTTPYGPVLVAAMYLMPSINGAGPMPGGCLTQWHAHTNLCTSNTTHLIEGFTPCPAGFTNYKTPMMLHVWQVPVPGGPLALDPTDLQVMQSAVMAQQNGEAPSTTPVPASSGASSSGASGGSSVPVLASPS
ncbi:MAG TPA: hypothetical protein VMU77_02385, partial [Acidimicrobiales bacterium]|nr:hypothetical protein [Acidimicrobiales bacterium]